MLQKFKNKIGKIIKYPDTPIGAILTLHRIDSIDTSHLWYNEHLKISANTLDNFIKEARQKGCTFISLDELFYILSKNKRSKKLICITLDDGYRDNYTNGLPLFESLNVPFCIYLTGNVPENKMFYWWYLIEDIILENNIINLSNGTSINCQTKEEKENAFLTIRSTIIRSRQGDLIQFMKKLFYCNDIDPLKYNKQIGLDWEQVKELSTNALATIGNHTTSHLSFNGCSNSTIYNDILKTQSLVKERTGLVMKHFSFPFGDAEAVSPKHLELLREMNFTTVATTIDDSVRYKTSPQLLPRKFTTEKNIHKVFSEIIYA